LSKNIDYIRGNVIQDNDFENLQKYGIKFQASVK